VAGAVEHRTRPHGILDLQVDVVGAAKYGIQLTAEETPFMMKEAYETLPVAADADVVVIGGGPGGLCAAVAAAEEGAGVLLVERYGFLGGMATAGLVNPFMSYFAGEEQVNAGLFQRLIETLQAKGGWSDRPKSRRAFDPRIMRFACDALAQDAGVRLLLHTFLVDAVADDGTVRLGVLAGKSGLQTVKGKLFIDASGDGDLAARAGATFEKGRPEDGHSQPMTLCFRMIGVDEERMPSRETINELYEDAKAAGEIDNPRENVLFFYTPRAGEVHFNTTRIVKHDSTDAASMTEAELVARRQVEQMARFLCERVPGFEDAYICEIAPQTGVRESRRIMGDYILTEDDVLTARKFADGIARGSYPVDIHNPAGTGTVIKKVPPGDAYDIPYRCLCPLGFDNMLIAGRPISSDHAAHSSHRVMPIASCNGEAAGVAAALCVRDRRDIRGVDADELRSLLKRRGASIYERR